MQDFGLKIFLNELYVEPIRSRDSDRSIFGVNECDPLQPRIVEEGVFVAAYKVTDLVPVGSKQSRHQLVSHVPWR